MERTGTSRSCLSLAKDRRNTYAENDNSSEARAKLERSESEARAKLEHHTFSCSNLADVHRRLTEIARAAKS